MSERERERERESYSHRCFPLTDEYICGVTPEKKYRDTENRKIKQMSDKQIKY